MSAATTWLDGNAPDLGIVDADTTRLLERRLAARRRAALLVAPVLAVAAVLLAISLWRWEGSAPGAWYPAGIAVGLLASVLMHLLGRRDDERIAAGLPRRVARGEHVGAAAVLGRPAVVAAVATPSLAVLWSVVLAACGHPGAAAVLAGWCLLCGGLAALGLRRALGRPAVAHDAASLAIDERLRAEEAVTAVRPLLLMWLAVAPFRDQVDGSGGALSRGFSLTFLVVTGLNVALLLPRRWRRPGPARPGPST